MVSDGSLCNPTAEPDAQPIMTITGDIAWVSAADHDAVAEYEWASLWANGMFSAKVQIGRFWQSLYRVVAGDPRRWWVDHINSNRHDCTRSNLRLATPAKNAKNCKKTSRPTSSRFIGVTQLSGGQWLATDTSKGFPKWLNVYDMEEDAARARDAVAYERHKEFTKLNFPSEYPRPTSNIEWPTRGSLATDVLAKAEARNIKPPMPYTLSDVSRRWDLSLEWDETLQQLNPDERDVLCRRVLSGESDRDIHKNTGLSRVRIHATYCDALRKLRDILGVTLTPSTPDTPRYQSYGDALCGKCGSEMSDFRGIIRVCHNCVLHLRLTTLTGECVLHRIAG